MGPKHNEASQHGSGSIVFIGVLALVLATVGGWLVLGSDSESETSVAAGDGELQPNSEAGMAEPSADTDSTYLVLDPAPADYRAFIADSNTPLGRRTVDIWGRVGAEDLFVDGDLAVVRLSGGTEELGDFGSDPTVEIAGRTVQPLDEDDGIHGVAWLEDDLTTAIVVASVAFDREAIIEIATGFLTSGQLDAQGLDLLAHDAAFAPALGPGSRGFNRVSYVHRSEFNDSSRSDDPSPEVFYLAAVDSSDGPDVVAAWFELFVDEQPPEQTTEPVAVGDFTGELVTYAYDSAGEFAWFELRFRLADGTEASISSQGVTVEELVALAVTTRRATPEEVQTMKHEYEELRAQEVQGTSTTTAPPIPQTSGDMTDTSGVSTTTGTVPTTTVTTGPPETVPTVTSPAETTATNEPTDTTEG